MATYREVFLREQNQYRIAQRSKRDSAESIARMPIGARYLVRYEDFSIVFRIRERVVDKKLGLITKLDPVDEFPSDEFRPEYEDLLCVVDE